MLVEAYTTNIIVKFFYSFVYLVYFAKFLPATNFDGSACEDLSTLAKICQPQTICS